MTAPIAGGPTITLGTVEWEVTARVDGLVAASSKVAAAERGISVAMGNSAVAMGKTGAAASATAAELAKAEERVKQLKAAFNALKIDPVGKEFEQATAEVSRLRAQLKGVVSDSDTTSSGLGRITRSLNQKKQGAEGAARSLKKVESGLVQIALSSTQTSGAVGSLIQGLLMFGVGSGAILGVAAAVSVLAKGYHLLTEDSRKAAERVRQAREEVQRTREEAKTPVERTTGTLDTIVQERIAATERLRELQRQLREISPQDQNTGQGVVLANDIAAQEKTLEKLKQDEAAARATRATAGREDRAEQLRDLREARQLGLAVADSAARERTLVAELRAIEADTSKPLKDRIEARRTLNELAEAERDRARELRSILQAGAQAAADLTKQLTDNAVVALDRFDAEVQDRLRNLNPADRGRAQAAFEQQRRLQVENLAAARALDSVAGAEQAMTFEQIDEAIVQLVLSQQSLTQGGQAYAAVEAKIVELQDRKTALMQAELNYAKQRSQVEDQLLAKAKVAAVGQINQQQMVDLIRDATRGALQLGEAFGLVGAETSQILRDVANLASDLPKLSSSISALRSGKGSAAEVVSSGLSVVGAVASVVTSIFGGDSEAERERRRQQAENTKAIQKLTDTIGEFGLAGVTGAAFADAAAGVALFASDPGRFREDPLRPGDLPGVRQGNLEAALRAKGTSRRELQDLADSLGLDVDFITDDFNKLKDAFKQLGAAMKEAQLTQFAKTFSGQVSALELEEAALRLTDPVAILERRRELLGRGPTEEGGDPLGSPALQKALAGLDLNTAEGRAQAQANILAVVQALKDGTLKPEDLGGLEGQEFEQAIREILDLLARADQNATGASDDTRNFSVARLITDNQADQLISLQVSANFYLSEIAARSLETRDLLGAMLYAFTGLQPPSMPPGTGTGTSTAGGLTIVISGDINVSITTAAGDTPAQWGQQAGAQVADGLLTTLGEQLRDRQLLAGRAGVG